MFAQLFKFIFNILLPSIKTVKEAQVIPFPDQPISSTPITTPTNLPASLTDIKQTPSSNYKHGFNKKNTAIVLHHTGSFNFKGDVDWMCNIQSGVSAHYCIGLEGQIVQLVQDGEIAWHAGESILDGERWVNTYSIGIECTGDTTQKAFTEPQYKALVWLVKQLMAKYGIDGAKVVSHREICVPPGRKLDLDSANFDWIQFHKDIETID